MILRQFNTSGIERFRKELERCKKNPFATMDIQLLEDDVFTEIVPGTATVEQKHFKTKGDAGNYLHPLLASTSLTPDNISTNTGLWSWLSLFFFDSVCPQNQQGRRRVNDAHYYIYDHRWNYYYRHLLFVSWKVRDIANGQHRLISSTKINEIDRVTRLIMNKLFVIRIPCIFEVLDRIYWNDATQQARKNITDSEIREGDLASRLPQVIRQLEKTYDLQSLNADQFMNLLGNEFDFSSR